jgi:hypothetical protein
LDSTRQRQRQVYNLGNGGVPVQWQFAVAMTVDGIQIQNMHKIIRNTHNLISISIYL